MAEDCLFPLAGREGSMPESARIPLSVFSPTRGLDPAKGVDFRIHRDDPHCYSTVLDNQTL